MALLFQMIIGFDQKATGATSRIKQGFTNLIMGIDVLFLRGAATASLEKIKKG